jgi:enoyl-[acyl-carrier-protein] reductase (NADH)
MARSIFLWASDKINDVKNHFIEYGRGQQALENGAHIKTFAESAKNMQNAISPLSEASESISESLQNINSGVLKVNNNINAVNENVQAVTNTMENIARSLTTFEKLYIVGSVITIAKAGYDFSCFIKSWGWPSEEEKIRKENTLRQLWILHYEGKLNECIIKNAQTKKDKDALPCNCREMADKFAEVAGPKALNEIVQEFNKYYMN